MADSRRKQIPSINLPSPPSSWNALSKKQLIHIHKLLGSGLSEVECKLKTFLYLMNLKVLKRAEKQDDGTFRFCFRRKGLRYVNERLGMQSWEVSYWIDKYLKFLNEPFHLVQLPFPYIRLEGRKYKTPDALMMNLTYEQYNNAQRYLIAYWEASRIVESLRKNGATIEALRSAENQALGYRAGFLAHMYVQGSWRILDQRGNMTRLSPRRVYAYGSEDAERQVKRFRTAPRWLFDVTYQFFQSSLGVYKKDFEFLFREYEDSQGKSALVMEIDTINAIQKYAGYNDQQAVYDSNVGFIFGFLNSMSHEAKQIEDMNNKLKMRR